MVDRNWNEFIRLAVISKEPQPVTRREREDLNKEIDQQTEYADIFKDKLEKCDRVNIPPVKLKFAESGNIQPVHINKPYYESYHMRKPAREEFRKMINVGILVPSNEPSDWCSPRGAGG